jgi:uncharacterized protein (TIGR03084 family)
MDIFDDLVAEQERLETILSGLPADAWLVESGAPGWTITDVVLHLAQSEEAVPATVAGTAIWQVEAETLDGVMDALVQAERAAPEVVFERWRVACRASVAALRQTDPAKRLLWAATPLKPGTLATTRLAEHWAHGLDITTPLGVAFPDTDRLRHIAWLAHSTLPYAFGLVGQPSAAVYCELTAPDGDIWRYGPPDAESTITGPAGAFCRVGARRLAPEDSGLVASGPHGPAALSVLRNYAA